MPEGLHTGMPSLMRGVAGGLLLGSPFLYTQEVWHLGASMQPLSIVLALAVTFGLSASLAYYVGFRRGAIHRPVEDAVVGTGVSLIVSAALLLLLRRIDLEMPAEIITGIVAVTALPVAIGFSIGNALAPREGGEGATDMTGTTGELLAAAGGAVVVTLNIAPTEEPLLIAGELTGLHLVLLVVASLLLSYVIVFYAEFGGKEQRRASDGAAQGPVTETALAYLVALALCAAMLGAFGHLDADNATGLATVVVLAFPAALGGALGRMLV